MTTFTTTRGGPGVQLEEAVFRGLGPDGGLYVPSVLPTLPVPGGSATVEGWGGYAGDFTSTAQWAAPSFFPTVEPRKLRAVVERALSFSVEIVEVEPGRFVLELFHGPTLAFKDVGARFMASLMPVLDREATLGEGVRHTVLVATSGDTGGAVANAFHGLPGYRVVVLFPTHGISERQRRQMTTLGDNVDALSVSGTFDDCQRLVKAAFADPALVRAHGLTSANSINVARLFPQSFYYIHAARRLGSVHFVVPSGNLGNLCAGLVAARAGMPTRGFTAASNANRPFTDFLGGAEFGARVSVQTSSNAMDVGAPSNFERLRWLYAGDDDALRRDVRGASISDKEVRACIGGVYRRTGYVMDPHTAVAYEASRRQDPEADTPTVVLSTAHPAKFPETVEAAIGRDVPVPEALAAIATTAERMTTIEPTDAALARALEGSAP
jgi:threonine synthase